MNIAIIGCGHVGLVTAVCFAAKGHKVIGVDNNLARIKLLQSGRSPIYEPGLELMLKRSIRNRRLSFSTASSLSDAVRFADVIFISVGTPLGKSGGADLSQVRRVARDVARSLNSAYKIIAEKSTVPVGTAEQLETTIRKYAPKNASFDIVSNPEFLQEGRAIDTTLYPDRIVVGVANKRSEQVMRRLYASFRAPILITDFNSAELIKHAANSFLATKISYINAIANICERSGADVRKVAQGVGMDNRIGKDFLNAGIGYGGFCLPKDVAAFVHIAGQLGYRFDLLRSVQRINEDQRRRFVHKIERALGTLRRRKIGVLGLSFKPDTDDIRESPAVAITGLLLARGAQVSAYDPQAMPNVRQTLASDPRASRLHFAHSPYDAARGAGCLVIATEWNEFRHLDLKRLRQIMKRPLIIDGRNIYDPAAMKKAGFEYIGVGF
jgi:UDPglucose 6-dehydrogenase